MGKSCYNRKKGDFEIKWPGKVARHDLVYLSPPTDPMQYGMPIGNGDIGALIWCEDRKIILAINKCDLWDDAGEGSFDSWDLETEEKRTTLRHACRVVIDFGMPIFDTFYLNDFVAHLHLQNGCVSMYLKGPFGTMTAELFITYEGSVFCGRIRTDFAEENGIRITMERYGSRTYSYWYARVKRNPSIGLLGTETWNDKECLFLSHRLTTGKFICAVRTEGDGIFVEKGTSHAISAQAKKCPKELTFYAHVTSPMELLTGEKQAKREQEEVACVKKLLEEASEQGFDVLLAENEVCWKQFWEKSFLETDDDYLDNLWHLAMYYACAGQRGRYPGRFINSLWNWNRDVQPWNYYFHWNQQEVYWGLNAAGHHELCDSYLEYRFRGMEHAREDAKRLFGVEDGLFVSDVCDRRGYNSIGEANNHTPAGEIALDFWRQYLYTGDETFLREKALPYMLGAARFFASLFEKRVDGKFHAKSGTAYEGTQLFSDSITELSMAKVLFPAVLQALELTQTTDADEKLFREILKQLAPIQMLSADSGMLRQNEDNTYTVQLGKMKGTIVKSGKVLALGCVSEDTLDEGMKAWAGQYVPQYISNKNEKEETKKPDGNEVVCDMLHQHSIPALRREEVTGPFSAHPQANIAPVFPMGMIGKKDKGSELYEAAVTTSLVSRNEQLMGWDPMPIALARLGLSDAVDAYVYDYPSAWQYYNNGFGHYGPNCVFLADKVSPFRRDLVKDAENMEESFWAETFPFRHMGLEPLGVFSAIMNERLLQSYDGIIRIIPAYGKRSARFKLHAVGGFEVMSEIEQGRPTFVAIRSLRGENIKLENPWESAWCEGCLYSETLIERKTEAGNCYLFTPDGKEDFAYEAEEPLPNQDYKVRRDGKAMLGLARSF